VTFKAYLNEATFKTLRVADDTIEVLRNPTSKEYQELIKDLKTKPYYVAGRPDVRGFISDGHLFLWAGNKLHDQMARVIEVFGRQAIPIYLIPGEKSVLVSTIMMTGQGYTTLDYHTDEDFIVHTIKKNKALKGILGSFSLSTI